MKSKICFILILLIISTAAQQNQKRNRAETYFDLHNSNTAGHGDIWVSFRGIGHIWDDDQVSFDTIDNKDRKWVSNVRLFPELRIESGLFNFASLFLESRVLSYGFKPGHISFGLKMTTPNNLDLRLHGIGLELTYLHHFIESNPSLGGYIGFMPEGFVVKGNSMEIKILYEFDLLARYSKIPLRYLLNIGTRIPFRKDRLDCVQLIANTGLIYSGYYYDFFIMYSILNISSI